MVMLPVGAPGALHQDAARRAVLDGARSAVGAPALASAVSFLAFGAAAQATGLGLGWTLAATFLVYGMAGQLVLLDAAQGVGGLGAGVAAVLGATAANARLMPMAVTLAPHLAPADGLRRRHLALLAPFIALTPWVAAMRQLPVLARPRRIAWFLGFALTVWAIVGVAAWFGHAAAAALDPRLLAALVFLNPLFFALSMVGEIRRPDARRAILAGACAALPCLLLPGAWGVLAAGLAGGTIAWGLQARNRSGVHA